MELQDGWLFDNKYLLKKRLGNGSFGEVWLAEDTEVDNLLVAVKIYAHLDQEGIADFKKEYSLAFNLHHSNLLHINYFGVCGNRPYLVMPYCPNGSASKFRGKMDEATAWRFIRDVASGLACLHAKNPPMLHQDIKPANVLIDENNNFLISDFGISKNLRSSMSQSQNGFSGTIPYSGPKKLRKKGAVTVKMSDIWALGASVYELIDGNLPFGEYGGYIQRCNEDYDKIDNPCSDELQNLIYSCLQYETWDRPSAEQLADYASDYIKGRKETPAWIKRIVDKKESSTIKDETLKTQKKIKLEDIKIENKISNNKPIDNSKYSSKTVQEKKINIQNKTQNEVPKENNCCIKKLTPRWASNVTTEQKSILTDLINSMVLVEGGTFWMGAQSIDPTWHNYDPEAKADEGPVHSVTLKDYYIGKYQVTQDQWKSVMLWDNEDAPLEIKINKKPKVSVSWEECQKFIRVLNDISGLTFSLPKEEQWEYAARGGNKSRGYKYSGGNDIKKVAVYNRFFLRYKTVGTKMPNELGLYDMSGNVREWCRDRWLKYDDSNYSELKYRSIPTTNNVYRGGGWFDRAKNCRVTSRNCKRGFVGSGLGFRLVLNIELNKKQIM